MAGGRGRDTGGHTVGARLHPFNDAEEPALPERGVICAVLRQTCRGLAACREKLSLSERVNGTIGGKDRQKTLGANDSARRKSAKMPGEKRPAKTPAKTHGETPWRKLPTPYRRKSGGGFGKPGEPKVRQIRTNSPGVGHMTRGAGLNGPPAAQRGVAAPRIRVVGGGLWGVGGQAARRGVAAGGEGPYFTSIPPWHAYVARFSRVRAAMRTAPGAGKVVPDDTNELREQSSFPTAVSGTLKTHSWRKGLECSTTTYPRRGALWCKNWDFGRLPLMETGAKVREIDYPFATVPRDCPAEEGATARPQHAQHNVHEPIRSYPQVNLSNGRVTQNPRKGRTGPFERNQPGRSETARCVRVCVNSTDRVTGCRADLPPYELMAPLFIWRAGDAQHVFGTTGIRSFQRWAGPRLARHQRRLASAGENRAPGNSGGTPGDPAPPPTCIKGSGRGGRHRGGRSCAVRRRRRRRAPPRAREPLGRRRRAPPRVPLVSQDTGASVARAWRGRGAGYSKFLTCVARAWRGLVL
eukprot:gene15703-biopygen14278